MLLAIKLNCPPFFQMALLLWLFFVFVITHLFLSFLLKWLKSIQLALEIDASKTGIRCVTTVCYQFEMKWGPLCSNTAINCDRQQRGRLLSPTSLHQPAVEWPITNSSWLQHVGNLCDSNYLLIADQFLLKWLQSVCKCLDTSCLNQVTCGVTLWPTVVMTTACTRSPTAQ